MALLPATYVTAACQCSVASARSIFKSLGDFSFFLFMRWQLQMNEIEIGMRVRVKGNVIFKCGSYVGYRLICYYVFYFGKLYLGTFFLDFNII